MRRLLLVLVHVIFFGQYPIVYLSPSRTRSLSASDLWVLALSLCSLSFESAQMLLPSRPHICLISPPHLFPHVLTSPFIVSSIIAPHVCLSFLDHLSLVCCSLTSKHVHPQYLGFETKCCKPRDRSCMVKEACDGDHLWTSPTVRR